MTISRENLHPCLRPVVFARCGLAAVALFSALPVAAGVIFVISFVCAVVCVVPLGVLWVGVVVGVLGALATVIGLLACLAEDAREQGGIAVGVGIVGIVIGALCHVGVEKWTAPLLAAYHDCVDFGCHSATFLWRDVFIAYNLHLWPWAVPGTALAIAGSILATIAVLRCEPSAKRFLLRVRYACPACHADRTPYHRCPNPACSELITDLAATRYGVFRARCGACRQAMPTADLLGRRSLGRVCPCCRRDLTHPDAGAHPEYHVAVVGATSGGKTNLVATAVQALEAFAAGQGFAVRFADAAEERRYHLWCDALRSGRPLDKTTTSPAPVAMHLSLVAPDGHGSLLYLYDPAGEEYEEADSMSGHGFHRLMDGVLLVVDPFAERGVVALTRGVPGGVNAAPAPAGAILSTFTDRLERVLDVPGRGRFPVSVAVVLTKCDAGGLEDLLREQFAVPMDEGYASAADVASAAGEAVRPSADVRRFLTERAGLANLVNRIETRFARCAFFAASPLGRTPSAADRSPFRPRRSLAPLLWLLHETGAMTDLRPLRTVFVNGWHSLGRAWRGLEGREAQTAVVSVAACFALLSLCLSWLFLGAAGALGLAAAALLCAAGAFLWRYCTRPTTAIDFAETEPGPE